MYYIHYNVLLEKPCNVFRLINMFLKLEENNSINKQHLVVFVALIIMVIGLLHHMILCLNMPKFYVFWCVLLPEITDTLK